LKTFIVCFYLNFEFVSVLNYREFINSNRGDMASLAGDHCSLIIRASQFSSTTRNLFPRFKRGVRGEGLVTNLAGLLILACTSGRGWSNTLMSSFLCCGHHDEVGVLSSGTPSYLRKNKGWAFWENGPRQGCLSGRQHRGRWRKVTLESKLKKISRAK
jgi:hypothetical protein